MVVSGMKKAVLFLCSAVLFVGLSFAQGHANYNPAPQAQVAHNQFLTVDEVRPGMKGIAYTVFEGTKPEPMGVEVLGVLRNQNGPKSDVVLVRLRGEKPEYTGVVAGMSGSPVYIDGKLLGAIAFRIGSFAKDPIAGVTPIAEMMEINEFDRSIPASLPVSSAKRPAGSDKTSSPGPSELGATQNYAQFLQPIDAPFVFNGFSESAIKIFADKFVAAGIVPVMGVGGASGEKQP